MFCLVLRHNAKNKLFPERPTNMCSGGFCSENSGKLISSSIDQKLTQLVRCTQLKDVCRRALEQYHHILCRSATVSDEFLVVDSYFLVSSQTNLFALLSWELHLLDSAFVMFAGQAALLSLAGESKVFFKCLNRWLPRSLEVKIKTCAWGLRAQNAIYSSSLISSGIPAWGLMVLEAHAHSAKYNSQMVIHNFEVAYSMKAFPCKHCCEPKLHFECLL